VAFPQATITPRSAITRIRKCTDRSIRAAYPTGNRPPSLVDRLSSDESVENATPQANPQDSPARSATPEWGCATPQANPQDSPATGARRPASCALPPTAP
jgi:hypothetical protein